jgi:DNA invertase Pin-like site-specific DNA recombinase
MSRGRAPEPQRREKIRCAIYTRKSTEEGLDQEFNSLDAQREACAAYIMSQRHEGWTLVPDYYDDGGFTGGNMERPGLKQLLADVEAGKVDVIVVYKVDRLTRALSDFAKIVDVLDAAGASFVSITQSFNTTTSMGRLTLNVLLSFAQFEREVISERVRDKVAASKRKGMWMGGNCPLGYDVQDRKLVVNEAEAETVRLMMRRYLELGSVYDLAAELRAKGITSKIHCNEEGRSWGGKPISPGALYHILDNQLYRGVVVHKGEAHPGEHIAIVDDELWTSVQEKLASNRIERRHQANANEVSLLAGMIRDGEGRRMTPSHASRGDVRCPPSAPMAQI